MQDNRCGVIIKRVHYDYECPMIYDYEYIQSFMTINVI